MLFGRGSVVNIYSNNVELTGFTIHHGEWLEAGLKIFSDSNYIHNNLIEFNFKFSYPFIESLIKFCAFNRFKKVREFLRI